MNEGEKLFEEIKTYIDEFESIYNKSNTSSDYINNRAIRELMTILIIKLKRNKVLYNQRKLSISDIIKSLDDAYIIGMYRAFVDNPRLSASTKDYNKINSLIFDIRSRVNLYLDQFNN